MNAKSFIPVDGEQRIEALNPLQSFICEAPAGSGKTELLTQRVLTLLARVSKPESILAITFTRKAAAEMRDRILGALHAGLGAEPSDDHAKTTWSLAQSVLEEDRKRNWNLLLNPNRLQIRTFDSLCSMLTQTLPIQSSLGASVGITSDADLLYKEAVSALMDSLEAEVPWAEPLFDLLVHLDNKYPRIEELLVKMLRNRDAWLPIVYMGESEGEVKHVLEKHLENALNDKKDQIEALIPENLKNRILEMGAFSASNIILSGVQSPIVALQNVDVSLEAEFDLNEAQWLALSVLLLTKTGEWRKRLDKNCGFPVGADKSEKSAFKTKKEQMSDLVHSLKVVPGLLESLQGVVFWPTRNYKADQWRFLQSLTQVLPILVAQLQVVFSRRGEVDFLEMSTRAHQALGSDTEPTDLALRLDHSIQHILADEFQDTSFAQIGLIQKLTAGWQVGDGRTLFCVGDAMQSIYGFRGANVGLFLNCKARGLGDIPLKVLQLSTNFRSQAGVVHWINDTFKEAFPPENDISSGAVVYAKADAFRPELEGGAIQTHMHTKGAPLDFEGERAVELIMDIQRQSSDSTIAILVRTKSHAKSAVKALKAKNIKFRAVDLEALADQEVIQDLMSLSCALLYLEDRISWFSILRSPWCGLSLKDMNIIAEQISHSDQELVFSQIQCLMSEQSSELLSKDGYQRLLRVAPTLIKAISERYRKPLRQWLEGVWLQLGGPACLKNRNDCDNAERFFQCLEALNASGEIPSKSVLMNNVNALFAAPDPEADGRLQIMTIHKSKGLEFDEVLLLGLQRRPRNQDTELLLWQERLSLDGNEEWLLAPMSASGEDKDPIYQYLEREKATRERLESCRLLYVACTRAKKRLHLFAELQAVEGEVSTYKAPPATSLLAAIWPSLNSVLLAPYQSPIQEGAGDAVMAAPSSPLVRLSKDWTMPVLPERFLLEPYIARSNFDNRNSISEVLQVKSKMPRYIGTLIHQILQVIGENGIEGWKNQDLTCKVAFWSSRLVDLGATEQEARDSMPDILDCIRGMLKSTRFQWLMSGNCYYEYPLTSFENGSTATCIIDLLMVDDSKQAWVVDYKTSRPDPEETIKGFLRREKTTYKAQLSKYKKLVEQLGYNSVKSALFFVTLDEWLEYE